MEYLLDSYAWLEYFGNNADYAPFVEGKKGGVPYTAASSLAEVVRVLVRRKLDKKDVLRAVQFVRDKSIVLPLESENAVAAGFLAEEFGLHFSDALIYSFAGKNRRLVTGDPHFKKLANVEFIE